MEARQVRHLRRSAARQDDVRRPPVAGPTPASSEALLDTRFPDAFEKAAIGMALVAFDGRFLRVNGPLAGMLGRDEQDLLRRTWQSVTHPEDVGLGAALVQRALSGGEASFELEKRYLHASGKTVWVLLSVSIVRDDSNEPLYMFTQVVDVSHLRAAEDARFQLLAIAESSDDALLDMAFDGTIIAWNRAAERLLGYTASQAIGRHLGLVAPCDQTDTLSRLLEEVKRDEAIPYRRTVLQNRQGQLVPVGVTVSAVRDRKGKPVGVSMIARDIRPDRRALPTGGSPPEPVALATAVPGQAARQLLADAAHQLRAPVAGIQACAETLLRRLPREDSDRLLANLVRETSRASQLIGALLRMGRLDHGEALQREACDVVVLCREEADRAAARADGIAIVVAAERFREKLPLLDAASIREILANLLDNAVRHARERIDVAVVFSPETVEIAVSDDGPGVPEAMVDRVFERFVSLDGAGGSGLGLPIARQLAHAHGGELSIEDGAFVLRLPYLPR